MAVLESEWKPSTAEGGGVALEFRLEGDLSRDRSVDIGGGGEEVAAEGGGGGEAREGGKASSLGEGGSGGEVEVEVGEKVVPLVEVKVEEEDVGGRRKEEEGNVGVERDVDEGEGKETVEDGGRDEGKVVVMEGRVDDEGGSGCQRADGEGAGEEGGGEVVDGEGLDTAGRLCGENEDRTEDGEVQARETSCGDDFSGHKSNVPNCAYYVMTGKCLNGQHCKFIHPSSSKKNQSHHKKVFQEEKTQLEDEWSIEENVNCKPEFEIVENGVSEEQWIDSHDARGGNWMDTNHNSLEKTVIEEEWNIAENVKCKTELETWENGGLEEKRMDNHDGRRDNRMDKSDHYFGRNKEHKFSNQPDCVHYLNTGKCSYGDRCKFKHEKKQVYSIKADMKEEDNKGEQENEALNSGWESDRNGCWDQGNEALKNEWESDGNGCWDQGNEVSKDGWENGEKVFWDDQHEGKVEDGWMEASEDYKIDNNAKKWAPDEGMTGQHGKKKDAFLYPRRPNVTDCAYYMKTGTCAYGQNCRFNHPYKERESQHDQHLHFDNEPRTRAMPQKEKFNHPYMERESQHDPPIRYNKGPRAQSIPQNDMFNHPYMEREKQYDRHIYSNNGPRTQATAQNASWEMDQRKWEHGHSGDQSTIYGRNGSREERGRQRTDERKIERQKVYWEKEQKGWGKELESEHSYEYPYRPTEPDCAYYLQTGTCAYGSDCKFNHPSLRVQIQCNLAPVVRKYGSDYRHEYPEKPEEEPLELNSMGLPIRHGQRECPYYMQNGSCKFSVNCRFHHPDPNGMGENDHHLVQNGRSQYGNGYQESRPSFPHRPKQSNCPYYMKNGTCKFGSGCKFYHPSDQESEDCLLSPIGLPLRPGQLVCTHYSQRGICKFGPACVYDHPMELSFTSRLNFIDLYNKGAILIWCPPTTVKGGYKA